MQNLIDLLTKDNISISELQEETVNMDYKTSEDGDNALMTACKYQKNPTIFEFLLNNGFAERINHVNDKNQTALMLLCKNKNIPENDALQILDLFLKSGAATSINLISNDYTFTALRYALLYTKPVSFIRKLFEAGANNVRYEFDTAIRYDPTWTYKIDRESSSVTDEIIGLFFQYDTSNSLKNNPETMIRLAEYRYYKLIDKHIIQKKVKYSKTEAINTLMKLCDQGPYGKKKLLEYLIHVMKAEVNVEFNENGETLIFRLLSTTYDKIESLKTLVNNGADVNHVCRDGKTPLLVACSNRLIYSVKVLLSAGANVYVKDNNDETPLMYATSLANVELVKILIDAGADVNAEDKDGKTPIIHAFDEYVSIDIIKLLVENGANVNHQSKNKGSFYTPLMMACSIRYISIVEYLLSIGADTTLKDHNEKTAEDIWNTGGRKPPKKKFVDIVEKIKKTYYNKAAQSIKTLSLLEKKGVAPHLPHDVLLNIASKDAYMPKCLENDYFTEKSKAYYTQARSINDISMLEL